MSDQIDDYAIVQAMARFGGSFAKALSDVAHKADPENLARLKAAFPELWTEYAEMARLAREHSR